MSCRITACPGGKDTCKRQLTIEFSEITSLQTLDCPGTAYVYEYRPDCSNDKHMQVANSLFRTLKPSEESDATLFLMKNASLPADVPWSLTCHQRQASSNAS